jgi:peptidoglycan/LPS O-acetylase OafA/YrhL
MRFDGQSRMGPLDIYSSASLAPLLRCLAEFSLGLLAYRWFRGISARTVQHDRCGRWSLTLTVLILSGMTIPDADVVVVAFFPLLIASLAQQTGPVSLFLASNVPVWLGEVSYSIYLLHGKFVRVVDWGDEALQPLGSVAHPTSVFLTILLVCACATVIHHSVERPCRILVRTAFERPGRRWRRRTVKANVVPLTAEPREG